MRLFPKNTIYILIIEQHTIPRTRQSQFGDRYIVCLERIPFRKVINLCCHVVVSLPPVPRCSASIRYRFNFEDLPVLYLYLITMAPIQFVFMPIYMYSCGAGVTGIYGSLPILGPGGPLCLGNWVPPGRPDPVA